MPLPELDPPVLVADAEGLDRLLEDLEGQREIAVDTEADSFFSYREKVCLVQLTVEDRDYLVDPLARGVELARLAGVFADPARTKVFHDSEYDVLILKRDFAFEFSGLFDTRVAAATLGSTSPGLASVLEERFGVVLDKSQQRSDWARRPLSDKQIAYARLDTRYLLPLMRELRAELAAAGRTMIVDSECRRLERLEPVPFASRPDEFVRIKGARALDPAGRRALRELYVLREELAESWNDPPFRVMNNPLLLALAQARPRSLRRLLDVPGFSPRMSRRLGERVLGALARARELPPIHELPVLPKKDGTEGMSEVEIELYERLKAWRRDVAEEWGIESSYLLNRHVMARLALARPLDRAGLAAAGLEPWQVERLGDGLLACLRAFQAEVDAGRVPAPSTWRGRRRSRSRRGDRSRADEAGGG